MRWITLKATSPSGKTLFACKYCGRVSPFPDKACPLPPMQPPNSPASPSCVELEEKERERLLHPILKNVVLPVPILVDRLRGLYRGKATAQARRLLNEQRDAIFQMTKHVVFIMLKEDRRLQWQIWEKLDALREELKRDE